MNQNFKAGLFVLASLILLVYITVRISQTSLLPGATYSLFLEVDTALGLSVNTPVQIAGVDIGTVQKISLSPETGRARLELAIKKDVVISESAVGVIKTTGILGDAIVEVRQKMPVVSALKAGDKFRESETVGDLSTVTDKVSDIADDVKAITSQLKKLVAGDDSPVDKTIKNIEKISTSLANVSTLNEKNLNAIIANVKTLSENLNKLVDNNSPQVTRTLYNIDSITNKINKGEGTVGKLINDDETVNRINESLENLNDFLGTANKLRVDFGLHSEYLGGTSEFKNYVSLYLRPRPDKYFLFEVTSDPSPSFTTQVEETTLESGGTSSTFTATKRVQSRDAFRFSAQLAKRFKDFTIRGGLIESTGGIGLDYDKGPMGLKFSAFDFKSDEGQRPHLKTMATANITDNFYLLAGLDDFLNEQQDLDWFMGIGLTFTDEDIKSIVGLISASGVGR